MKIKLPTLLKNHPSITVVAFALLLCTGVLGCKMFGTNPSPPTGLERAVFDVVTNHVVVTNVVQLPMPVYQTNFYVVTNVVQVSGQPPTLVYSNYSERVIDHFVTNTVQVPATNDTYTLSTKDSTKSGVQTVGGLVNMFYPGAGGLVSMGILAILGAWGHLRGNKNGNTAVAISQEVETIRNFVKMLPNGQSYDDALTRFMQDHQLETGVVQNVLGILQNKINNEDARTAAKEIADTLGALMPPSPAPSTTTQAPAKA
jgi:hypothetical protein